MPEMKEQMARAIEMSLAHEVEAELLYSKASQLNLAEENKATLSFLAKEESKHLQELRERFDDLIEELGLAEKVSVEAIIADALPRVEDKLARMNLQDLPFRDILEMALKEERKAKELYLLNASIFTDPELKQFFVMLAKDEEEHIKTLKALLHLVDKDIISPDQLPKH